MSLFTSAPVQPGAMRPLQEGGGTDYYTKKTKVSQYANANVYPTYGFKIYESAPSPFDERSGHTSTVVGQPLSKMMGQPIVGDIFTPADPEMEKLTQYFSRVVPASTKSIQATMTIKQHGLGALLERYVQGKLQDDVNVVNARMAGATEVERQLAMARLQDRYSEFIRVYGSEERLRQALLNQYIGGIPDPSVRGALAMEMRAGTEMGGATTMALSPGDVSTRAGAVGDVDRATYVEAVPDMAEETEMDVEAMRSDELHRQRKERLDTINAEMQLLRGRASLLEAEAKEIDSATGQSGRRPAGAVARQRAIIRESQTIGQRLVALQSEFDGILAQLDAEGEGRTVAPQGSVRDPTEFDAQTEAMSAVPMPSASAVGAGLDSGLAMGAGNPGADTEFTVGTFTPGHHTERGIAGGLGSTRAVVDRIERQPPSAPGFALASQDIGASQTYRDLTAGQRASMARADGGDLLSVASIFGGATTDPGSVGAGGGATQTTMTEFLGRPRPPPKQARVSGGALPPS